MTEHVDSGVHRVLSEVCRAMGMPEGEDADPVAFARELRMGQPRTATHPALLDLFFEVEQHIKKNSTLEMGGRKFKTPSIAKLADALAHARECTEQPKPAPNVLRELWPVVGAHLDDIEYLVTAREPHMRKHVMQELTKLRRLLTPR